MQNVQKTLQFVKKFEKNKVEKDKMNSERLGTDLPVVKSPCRLWMWTLVSVRADDWCNSNSSWFTIFSCQVQVNMLYLHMLKTKLLANDRKKWCDLNEGGKEHL